MRGATVLNKEIFAQGTISIHAPHAGRDGRKNEGLSAEKISIHAPHAGRDGIRLIHSMLKIPFQSTRPMRGATLQFLSNDDL